MAIKRVDKVSIYVSDQDKAIDFYTNKLGFKLQQDASFSSEGKPSRWVEVSIPGDETSIILVQGYGDWNMDKVGKFSGIVFTTDDAEGTYEQFKAKGVEFSEKPNRQPWGIQSQFLDQDGNSFVLSEPAQDYKG